MCIRDRFYADRPNEKWLTDVTEFHYYTGTNMRKLYLSAILDPVSYTHLDVYKRQGKYISISASKNNF